MPNYQGKGEQSLDGALQTVMALREQYPLDSDLANLDHEIFMQRIGPVGLPLPIVYYLTKKTLQSHPALQAIGEKSTLGGLLDQPILDEKTTPASLEQMMAGLRGALRIK